MIVKYKIVTSGFKDYVSFCLGDTEIVQIKTTKDNCGWISQELNVVVTRANTYMQAMTEMSKLRGMEAWLGDRKMKELFQKTLYPVLDRYETEINNNIQP